MESVKSAACKNRKPPDTLGRLDKSSIYKVDGKTFIVEPIFKQDVKETAVAILVNFMRTDASRF